MANDVAGVVAALVTLAGGVQAFRSPAARRQAWEAIGGLRELDKTILLTTHYLDEAQALADRVAIIAAGRIVAEGTPADLAAAQHVTEIRFTLPADAAPAELPRVSGRVATGSRNVEISTDDPTTTCSPSPVGGRPRRWPPGRSDRHPPEP